MLSLFERYLQQIDFKNLLEEVGLSDAETLAENIEYFTEKEAEKRDEIVTSYFGETGVDKIVHEVTKNLEKLDKESAILDVGAGTGFFTIKIAEKFSGHNLDFYALDATPAMLAVLVKKLRGLKKVSITPTLGVAERISESLNTSRKVYEPLGIILPMCFDAVISILMLHHCRNVSEVFSSVEGVVNYGGKLVLIDLCKHNFREFKETMGDVHLGFELDYIESELAEIFEVERIDRMRQACRCRETGRSTDLFIAVVSRPQRK